MRGGSAAARAPRFARRRGRRLRCLGSANGEQEAAHRNILVELRPVDANAAADEAPVGELRGGGVSQLREPLQRNVNAAPVLELDDEITIDDVDADRAGLLRCRNAHAISPEIRAGAE